MRRALCQGFQPTRPLRGATIPGIAHNTITPISTHAPLAGRDDSAPTRGACISNFNPRAPCGARRWRRRGSARKINFNPRAPCGARPLSPPRLAGRRWDFNPRAPCGARHCRWHGWTVIQLISTHAPLAGRDVVVKRRGHCLNISTHAPLAGRDGGKASDYDKFQISTHAPLAGRDLEPPTVVPAENDFNPRAPCGARPFFCFWLSLFANFNPRAPCGARLLLLLRLYFLLTNFNPRAPCGARPKRT